ncbi:MAG: restriction endonuclease subunit S [Candidatus Gracilibacteria bacterium]|nr:restriction endonuclease subunit S [Candidatus Gracilibacteria bacterium]MDQ7022662.1 restriction endonuclease subunit S [Candidatus Gracilibacteria bacterium]
MLNTKQWKYFKYTDIFEIKNGKRVIVGDNILKNGKFNFVSAIDHNNGVFGRTDLPPNHKLGTIAVNYDGNGVAEAYYQDEDFWALDSVNVLYPKFEINIYLIIFYNLNKKRKI